MSRQTKIQIVWLAFSAMALTRVAVFAFVRNQSALPAPFAEVSAIPTTFFIDPSGAVKLAALGLVPLEEAKAILHAKL